MSTENGILRIRSNLVNKICRKVSYNRESRQIDNDYNSHNSLSTRRKRTTLSPSNSEPHRNTRLVRISWTAQPLLSIEESPFKSILTTDSGPRAGPLGESARYPLCVNVKGVPIKSLLLMIYVLF